eukprot:CAMPEP_0185785166 /NCGR_PEP_ID=MMETSP1174-20130828/128008_1 /TAXON_ID=35687 /ORGANISM="Dictyocha speculum, Strain CCMP1381" /LENGTH=155 /DNA_ID=CAMNT_0028477127 /DNA_START=72 /DNA_END=536 /DNA_ORIENTATION=+
MGVAALPAFIQLLGFVWLPESPRWLIHKNRLQEAQLIQAQLYSEGTSIQEIVEISPEQERAAGDKMELKRLWTDHGLRYRFMLALGLMSLQQFSGINTIMYYGGDILIKAGLSSSLSIQLTALLAFAQACGIAVSIRLMDKIGRRPVIIPSILLA